MESSIESCSSLYEALHSAAFPVFLANDGKPVLVLEERTDLPKLLIVSIPRSGTHLTGRLAHRLGFRFTGLHLSPKTEPDTVQDRRFMRPAVEASAIWKTYAIQLKHILRLLRPGQYVQGHVPFAPELVPELEGIKVVYVSRNIRNVVISGMRFIESETAAGNVMPPRLDVGWCGLDDVEEKIVRFLSSFGPGLAESIGALMPWRNLPGVFEFDFDVIGTVPPNQQSLSYFAEFAGFLGVELSEEAAAQTLLSVIGKSTETWSGELSDYRKGWTDRIQEAFDEAGLGKYVTEGERERVGPPLAGGSEARATPDRKVAPRVHDLQMLPGSHYAKYALPLDHPPSRDLRPRWGNARPPIPVLHNWFRAHAARYDAFLDEMERSLAALDKVPQQFSTELLPEPAWFGVPFAPIDSVALYTMVRQRRPQTYIEIGSGITTCFVAKAVRDNSLATRIVSIDPAPPAAIDGICDEVIRDRLETCNLDRFAALRPNDILFFDGSHRSFMNSDVTVFMIDVLPRLQPGVIVHVHDVFLPWDYPELFVDWYWNEQYLLAAYMIGARERLDPILPTAFLCRDEAFAARFARPLIDFGDARLNAGWRGGGSMWFAHL